MIINSNRNKGITLISMILTVIVLLIIIGTISYSSRSSFETKKLEDLYSDIDSLYDAISIYYVKNKTLPVYYSDKTITGEKIEYQPIAFSEVEDSKYTYYIIDITKLNNIVLNNKNNVPEGIDSGSYCEDEPEQSGESSGDDTYVSDFDKALNNGMFVVNSSTHAIYYTKGVTVDDVTYYTKNEQFSKIPTFSKIDKRSIEDDLLDKDDKVQGYNDEYITIIFYANGGTDAPDKISVSRKDEDSLKEILNNGIRTPNKNGMKFVGWATSADTVTPLYEYKELEQTQYICNDVDISLSQWTSNIIELYAVWKVDENNILYYYYPFNSGGGVRPTLDNNNYIIDRTGVGDSVRNSLCIDIPSSGYTISWEWDEKSEASEKALQVAQFIGTSQTNNIQLRNDSNKIKYQTTEAGRIEVKGSFSNFQITLNPIFEQEEVAYQENDEDLNVVILKEKQESEYDLIKTVSFYQIKDTKDTCGGKITKEWLTGGNGKMLVPSTIKTYADFGLVDPSELKENQDFEYDYAFDDKSLYYLKSVIMTDEEKILNSSDTPIDYTMLQYQLGNQISITDENNCLYLCFGARNYVITNSSGGVKIYHESILEAFNDCSSRGYDKITLVRNVNDFGSLKNATTSEELKSLENKKKFYQTVTPNRYVDTHDPTYAKESILSGYNSYITLDCSEYTLTRQSSLVVNYLLSLNITSSSLGGIEFYDNENKKAIIIAGTSNLYLTNNVEINSNNGNVVSLIENGSLYIHKGKIKNTSDTNPGAIISNSANTKIYLGIDTINYDLNDDNYVEDGNVIISTNKGLVIDTAGVLVWKSGILKTADYTNKQGYNDQVEGKILARRNKENNKLQKPCLYFDYSEMMIGIRLGVRDWSFEDKDYIGGQLKTYYSTCLQDAHDCINLSSKSSTNSERILKIKWLNPIANSGEKNDAEITKPGIIIDFNSYNRSGFTFNTSQLNIAATTTNEENAIILQGLKCETQKGFVFNNSNVIIKKSILGNSKIGTATNTIAMTNSVVTIGNDIDKSTIYTQADAYAIFKKSGTLKIDSNTELYTNASYGVIRNYDGEVNVLNSNIYSEKVGSSSAPGYLILNETDKSNLIIENSILESKTKTTTIYNYGKCDIIGSSKILSNADGSLTNGSVKFHGIMNYKELNILDNVYLKANYCVYSGSGGILNVNGQVTTVAKNIAYNISGARGSTSTMILDGNYLENGEWVSPIIEVNSTTGRAIYIDKEATCTMGNNENIDNFRVIKQLCPIIKTAGVGVHLNTSTSVFNFNNGVIYGKNQFNSEITVNISQQYNAIYNKSGLGTINIRDKCEIAREVNKTIDIQGTEYSNLQKIYISLDCAFMDNLGNIYDDINSMFGNVAQNPNITEVILNKNTSISNTNFSPTQVRGDNPLTLDFNGKTMNVSDNGIINSGTLIIKDSTLRDSQLPSINGTTSNNGFVIKNEWNGKLILSGNGKIAGLNRYTIINAGEMIVEDNFEIENNYTSQNSNEFGTAIAANNSTVLVKGNAKITSLNYGIGSEGNAATNSQITITDNASIIAGNLAVASKNGTVIVKNSENSTEGPKIISTSDSGIGIETARLTLGTKDGNVNTNYPMIQAKNIGIKVTSVFNFYDGSIWAPTPRNVTGRTVLESGYSIKNSAQSIDIQGEIVNVKNEYLGR